MVRQVVRVYDKKKKGAYLSMFPPSLTVASEDIDYVTNRKFPEYGEDGISFCLCAKYQGVCPSWGYLEDEDWETIKEEWMRKYVPDDDDRTRCVFGINEVKTTSNIDNLVSMYCPLGKPEKVGKKKVYPPVPLIQIMFWDDRVSRIYRECQKLNCPQDMKLKGERGKMLYTPIIVRRYGERGDQNGRRKRDMQRM